MAFVKASNRNVVVSSLLSPHAAIFKAFYATQNTSPSRLSPTAAEFVVPSTYVITTSDLSPHDVPFVTMSTMQAVYDLCQQATCFVPAWPYWMTPESELSPRATIFIPMSSYETTYESGLSPHAAIFIPTSAEESAYDGDVAHVHPTLPNNYRPGMERIERTIESCEADLVSQYNDLKQHQDECARHYNAFVKWKYHERYDEPCQDLDVESVQYLANARNFRCTKCGNRSLELKRQYQYTYYKYMRLLAMHDRASVDFANT
jgi:hypothetical protein